MVLSLVHLNLCVTYDVVVLDIEDYSNPDNIRFNVNIKNKSIEEASKYLTHLKHLLDDTVIDKWVCLCRMISRISKEYEHVKSIEFYNYHWDTAWKQEINLLFADGFVQFSRQTYEELKMSTDIVDFVKSHIIFDEPVESSN